LISHSTGELGVQALERFILNSNRLTEKVCIVGSEKTLNRQKSPGYSLFFSFPFLSRLSKGASQSPPTTFICFFDFVHPDSHAPSQTHHCQHKRRLYCN
jgi:hypothetical protein